MRFLSSLLVGCVAALSMTSSVSSAVNPASLLGRWSYPMTTRDGTNDNFVQIEAKDATLSTFAVHIWAMNPAENMCDLDLNASLDKQSGVLTPIDPPAECKDVKITLTSKGVTVTEDADASCSRANCGAGVMIGGDFPHHRPLVHSDFENLSGEGGDIDPSQITALLEFNKKYFGNDPLDILGEYSYHAQTNLGAVDNSVTIFAEDYRLHSFIASFSTVSSQGNICDFSAKMNWNQATNVLTPAHSSADCAKLSIHLGPHGAEVVDPDGKCSQPNCGMGAYLSGKFPKHKPLSQKMIDGFKNDPANDQFTGLKDFAEANKFFIPKTPANKPQPHPAHPAPPKGKKAPSKATAHSGLEASEEPQYGEHRRQHRASKIQVDVNVEI